VKGIRLGILFAVLGLILLVCVNADVDLPHSVYKSGILLFLIVLTFLISQELNASFLKHFIRFIVSIFAVWCALTKESHDVLTYISN